MMSAIALAILIPLAFWAFEVLVKVLGEFPVDDIGADLCLFGVSFNGSTMLAAAVSARAYPAASGGIFVVSLLLYMFAMILVSPKNFPYPLIQWLRPWKVGLTVSLGFAALFVEIILYIKLLEASGS
jgi:hypothetical protein